MASQIVKDFNNLLEALIQQTASFTDNSYHFLFKSLIKVNAVAPIQTFNQYAVPWKDHIENRDEAFFLREDVVKTTTNDNNALHDIFKLQGTWKHLDNNSKDNLWEMMNALLMLGEQYHKLKN